MSLGLPTINYALRKELVKNVNLINWHTYLPNTTATTVHNGSRS